jgi:flagellar motor switch protein FliN/FliY
MFTGGETKMVSDELLSQDEIDALLRGTQFADDDETPSTDRPPVDEYLSSMEQDALGEIGNISFGSSATALSTLLNQKVEITTPSVSVIYRSKLEDEFPHPYVAIHVRYTEGFTGTNLLVIKQSDAAIIADLMLGGTGLNPSGMMDEIQLSAVQEAMNQMMGSAATSMSTVFSKKVDISPPSIDLLDLKQGEGADRIPDDEILVKVSFRLKIGDLIDSSIMQLLPIDFAKNLVQELLNPSSNKQEAETNKNNHHDIQSYQKDSYSNAHDESKTQSYTTSSYSHSSHSAASMSHSQQYANVQPAEFASFEQTEVQQTETRNLDMLLDIPLQVTVELGRTKRSVKEILELSSGSIIELDKLAGEPVDILVNNKLVAKGEVVVIDENFGVRVTDIISQSDRIKKLR